jgi:hypothetical protein
MLGNDDSTTSQSLRAGILPALGWPSQPPHLIEFTCLRMTIWIGRNQGLKTIAVSQNFVSRFSD